MNITDKSTIYSADGKDLSSAEYNLLQKLQKWVADAENSIPESTWREEAQEDYAFYAGDQDPTEVKDSLRAQNRPTTTFNEIKPKIDKLVGLADQVRRAPTALPVTREDEALAELTNGTFKHFRYTQSIGDKEMDCFEHTVKSGRSFLYFHIDKSNPFTPEIKAMRLAGRDVLVDPDFTGYDINDARYIAISRWFKEEDILAHWPEFEAADVRTMETSVSTYTPSYFDETKELYRLIEIYFKVPERAVWFFNPLTEKHECLSRGEWREFKKAVEGGITLPDGRTLNEVPKAVESVKNTIHYAIFSGGVLLESGKSPYDYEGYPIVLYGAYKNEDENRWFGATTMMKDPQVSLNTMRRQLSHLLQTSPKGILMHEVGAILNIDEYDTRSAEPNFRLEMARDSLGRAKFTDQPQISNIYSILDGTFQQSMKDVSGIQDPLMGKQTSSREPGVTARLRLESNIAVLYIVLKNFRISRVQGGKLLLSLIQQYVKTPRVIRIEGEKGMQLLDINTQFNPQAEGFNDMSAGKFDLQIDEAAENATMRREIAQMLMDLAHNNPDSIPPDVIMEYIDLPLTAKTRVKEYNEARMQQEYELRMMEIEAKRSKVDLSDKKK
jgi:hypothetical protein